MRYSLLDLEDVQAHEKSNQEAVLKITEEACLKTERHWCLLSVWDWWQLSSLLNRSYFKLWLLTTDLILALGISIIIITLNNSLDLLMTIENSLEILKTTRGFSYILLVVWSLIYILLDPHLCGFRVLVLLTNYRVTRYFTVLSHT